MMMKMMIMGRKKMMCYIAGTPVLKACKAQPANYDDDEDIYDEDADEDNDKDDDEDFGEGKGCCITKLKV